MHIICIATSFHIISQISRHLNNIQHYPPSTSPLLTVSQTQSARSRTVGPMIFSHHFPSSVWRWTSLVEWLPLSSSELQCCWTGQPGRWAGSLYAAAGSYRPALSPGRAGRSTVPAARSYSSRCCQTERPDCDWTKNKSKSDEGHVMTYMHI